MKSEALGQNLVPLASKKTPKNQTNKKPQKIPKAPKTQIRFQQKNFTNIFYITTNLAKCQKK